MGPVTSAIIAAITAGALSGLQEVGKAALVDAYRRLKDLLARKFGHHSGVMQALLNLEAKPASEGRQKTLDEELAAVHAQRDPEIWTATQHLQQQVYIQQQFINLGTIKGSVNVNQNVRVNSPTVNVHLREFISIALIVCGLLMIPTAAMIPVINAFGQFMNSMIRSAPASSGSSDASFTAFVSAFGTTAYILICATVAIGIFLVVAGFRMRRTLKKIRGS